MTTLTKSPMDPLVQPGRDFWHGVLAAGGSTTVPRRTLDPVPGVADYETPISRQMVVAAGRLAYAQGVPLRSLLLAAHAPRVLARRCPASADVVVGYLAAPVVRPLFPPASLLDQTASWRALVEKTRRAESALRASTPGSQSTISRRELGVSGPSFETVFDPTGAGEVSGDAVLHVSFPGAERPPHAAAPRYRTDVLDAGCAARTRRLPLPPRSAQILAAPGRRAPPAEPAVGRRALRLQLDGCAPAASCRPAGRTSLFEQRGAAHPDAVAAVHDDQRWTYRELNARANRVAPGSASAWPAPRGCGRRGDRAEPGLDGIGHRRP